jgi:hypothetical protein
MADDEYGWFVTDGQTNVRVSALAGAYTVLNVTATPGQLDDDATSGSETIVGLVLHVAAVGASLVKGTLIDAKVGPPLA